MFHGLCFRVCTHSILMNIPFHPSIKFWPFLVGLVRLPTEKAPGKGCQNLVPDIHLQLDHQPLTLQNMAGEFVKTLLWRNKVTYSIFFDKLAFFCNRYKLPYSNFILISYHVSFDTSSEPTVDYASFLSPSPGDGERNEA